MATFTATTTTIPISSKTSTEEPIPITQLKIEPEQFNRFKKTWHFFANDDNAENIRATKLRPGYEAHRALFPDKSVQSWAKIADEGIKRVKKVIEDVAAGNDGPEALSIENRLSPSMQAWRDEQIAAGRSLPPKGFGLVQTPSACQDIMNVRDLPPSALTTCSFFGAGMSNFILGAYDAKVLVSNYVVDMGFYTEHTYEKVFPDFSRSFEDSIKDPYARSTPGGAYRRDVAMEGIRYIRAKNEWERKSQKNSVCRTASKFNREDALIINLCESSFWGFAAEPIDLGADLGCAVAELAISTPAHDVVDVGSDMRNSELFSSFLMTKDIAETGEVSEEVLRRVYDAYAWNAARLWTEGWYEPVTRMLAALLSWHVQNDRHNWLRRIVLGYPKARSYNGEQREADFEETFDENFHTTGFSRPLKNPCNGEVVCDHVQEMFDKYHGDPLLKELWYYFSEANLEYAKNGVIDPDRENEIIEGSRIAMCRAYSYGLTEELSWILSHASHHAWQIDYLFEASMFGSFLDDGSLQGTLDRFTG